MEKKIDRENFEKKIIKKKKNKTMWGNTVAIYSVLKEKNYKANVTSSNYNVMKSQTFLY
jgi:hypothetical protein